ncbi:MAG: exodeoxyribonuclease III [Bdellovibrio sp. CG10_big_fil_rev_8_21_14_0_10_47_8]|nr:MAG: exodeoxyribonuclease III [Bdellovibrio sp. CG10_big_fil_rev_8_21_14_0_10_47_8]
MSDKLKIISWNVNGIRACAKKGLADFLAEAKPNLFCVQETKAHIDQVEEAVRTLGFQKSYWSSAVRKGYSGVATFADQEPKKVSLGIDHHPYDSEGRFVITEHPQFDLYNIYFPNGGSGEERHSFKQQFLKDLNVHLKAQLKLGKQIVVVGDYNVAHKEIDVYDPVRLSKESGFLPEEREWFDAFLNLGFVDSFRHFNPEAKDRYSWWSYRELARLGNRGWRIDYICVSKGLKKHLSSADIMDSTEGSDHCPVVVELEF